MSILSDLKNRIFQTEAINTNVSTKQFQNLRRISLGDHENRLTYKKGKQILEDLTVTMSYDVLKKLHRRQTPRAVQEAAKEGDR